MKKHFFLLLLLFPCMLQATIPIIDYAKITQWCSSSNLRYPELVIMESYLQLLSKLSQNCAQEPQWIVSNEAQDIQHKIDTIVTIIMMNKNLQAFFQDFTYLLKEELNQKMYDDGPDGKSKGYYEIVALVVTGCLDCVQREMENSKS
jgi:hypothetical protein